MRFNTVRNLCALSSCLAAIAVASPALADEAADAAEAGFSDAIIVTGTRATYNNSALSEQLIADQPPLASVLDLADSLPGVQIQEGDAFGFDDWSTAVTVRGFQTNLDQQQVGMTIDGLPNGGSNYGGGAKANRYVDTMNIRTVEVSQGTADIGSLSNEALGGTLNFVTSDPLNDRRMRLSASAGEFDALRYYARYDTGLLLNDMVRAWVSYSHQEATDWVNGSAQNHRDHFAGKFILDLPVKLTGYVSYDDTHEDNYDQVYSAAQYTAYPHTDGLTAEWTGVPYQDQAYRRAWSTLRKNFFAYIKADAELANAIEIHAAAYYHDMAGRGDWVPQYVVNLTADGLGQPESELSGQSTVLGGSSLGLITFVNGQGVALSPTPGCVGSITYPYGGTTNPAYDPACFAPGAIGAQSYRHTHYRKDRTGGTVDASWKAQFGMVENTLRGGLWYEDTNREEWRDWHNVLDTTVGPDYADRPYWTQYSRRYPQDTFKWFVQDSVTLGPVTAHLGAKQFVNNVDRVDLFGDSTNTGFKSTSDVLLSGGIQAEPMPGLNLFAGYAENFKALTDAVLEFSNADLSQLKPETSENWELGVRYDNGWFSGSATWFKAKFSNQVIFVSNSTAAGNNYLGEGDGKFFNAGGIDSEGFELLANVRPMAGLNLYGSYTHIDATYRGTGNATLDAEQGVTPGNKVAGIPKDMWVLSANYEYGPVSLGVTGKYTGDRFVDAANSWVAQNYILTDLNLNVKGEALSPALKPVTLSLTVNNLTDENYLGGISGGYAWIGAPRTFVLTATADF